MVVMSTASLAGLTDSPEVAIWIGAAVALTAVLSLATEPFAGVVIGLAAAAALIAGRRVLGPWGPGAFWPSAAQTVALVATGAASGWAGMALRPRRAGDAPSLLPRPAFGSLGLLDADVAMVRLDEEAERAIEHRRPLALVLLDTKVIDPSIDGDARRSALRAVARIFEGRLREGDVPFAIEAHRLGAILPETTSPEAWERVGLVLDAVGHGRFRVRSDDRGDRPLSGAVHIDVGIAQLGPRARSADELFDAATEVLRREHTARDEAGDR
jgi:GGDEF domain-containing protein